MAGRDLKDDGAAGLHLDENFQARLEDARARRAKALREKERLKAASGDQDTEKKVRLKPWQLEAAKPISPIIQEKDLDRDALDFADRVNAIRHTAQNAPEPDNDAPDQTPNLATPKVDLDEEVFLQEAAATLQPGAEEPDAQPVEAPTADETPDPNEVLLLSKRYASALEAFTETASTEEQTAQEPETAEVDEETAERFATSLASIQDTADADVVVDLSDRYVAPDIEVYPGADPELAKRYAAALAAFAPTVKIESPDHDRSVAAGGRRLFMLTSLVILVGFLTLPLIPTQPVENGPEPVTTPNPGLQPALGTSEGLQDTFAMAVPLLQRVAPAAPLLPVVASPAETGPAPAALPVPGELVAPDATARADLPVQRDQHRSVLHDPLSADRTLVTGLSPNVTALADAVVPPQRLVRKLPEFNNVRNEVRPSVLDGSDVAPISGTIVVTALETDDAFDALAAAIAEDVARSLRR